MNKVRVLCGKYAGQVGEVMDASEGGTGAYGDRRYGRARVLFDTPVRHAEGGAVGVTLSWWFESHEIKAVA